MKSIGIYDNDKAEGETENLEVDTIVLGGGLTGLTTAYLLGRRGVDTILIEREPRLGGQIQTYARDGFFFETGPNTGIISKVEVQHLFDSLARDGADILALAKPSARRRLILKDGVFRPLPSGLKSAITTNLFTWRDKLRILGEPFRAKGTDPNESIATLVERRLGRSYLRYAVDPFVGGIYAGDPHSLVTRHALPKLYALEQGYGSFVRGAIAKMREPNVAPKPSKAVFSSHRGLSSLVSVLADGIGREYIYEQTHVSELVYKGENHWELKLKTPVRSYSVRVKRIVSTIGAYALREVFPFLRESELSAIESMRYAPVVQVAVGYKDARDIDFDAFGGLVPSIEDQDLLGILNPSASFSGRAPEGGLLLSVFLGGLRSPKLIDWSNEEIEALVLSRLNSMLGISQTPDLIHIARHRYAIPQYEASSDDRLRAITCIEKQYKGLFLAGGIRDGIGMADRIAQAYQICKAIDEDRIS